MPTKKTAFKTKTSKAKRNGHQPAPEPAIEIAPGVSVTTAPLSQFQTDPNNLNDHTPRGHSLLTREIQEHGIGRPMFATADGVMAAGNLTKEVIHEVSDGDPQVIVIRTDGKTPIIHQRTDLQSGDQAAIEMALADNWIASVSMNLNAAALRKLDPTIANRYFFAEELARLLQPGDEVMGQGISGVTHGLPDKRRQIPLDVIFTVTFTGSCCLAAGCGLKYGFWSKKRVCHNATLEGPHRVTFIDNEYKAYDHDKHLALVQRWRPKYATVRDLMDQDQCAAAGIPFYSFDQIMRWAEDVKRYAQHVILIPKYDCLSDIPAEYVLGYSVPTTHGGTPLPIDLFRSRPVHLLGGSWKEQLAYLNDLGDDVVSLDNNYISNMARFGKYTTPDGDVLELYDGMAPDVANPLYVALAISMGNIARKVIDLHDERAGFKLDDSWTNEAEPDDQNGNLG
jgi:hypothetical protein